MITKLKIGDTVTVPHYGYPFTVVLVRPLTVTLRAGTFYLHVPATKCKPA